MNVQTESKPKREELRRGTPVWLIERDRRFAGTISGMTKRDFHVRLESSGITHSVGITRLRLREIGPRQCMVILPTQCDDNGFIPSLVKEGEAGHSPMMGQGECAAPWYWGKTYHEASKICDDYNLKTFGLDKLECLKILASSMRKGRP